MCPSTYYLEYGRHVGRLRRRRRRRRHAYAPTSNTASHDNHEKINSWVSFSFLYEYGAPLGGLSGRRSSAKSNCTCGPTGEQFIMGTLYSKESNNAFNRSDRCSLVYNHDVHLKKNWWAYHEMQRTTWPFHFFPQRTMQSVVKKSDRLGDSRQKILT